MYHNFLPNYLEELDDLDPNVGNSYEVSSNSGSTSSSQSGDSSLGSPSSYSAFSQVFRPKNLKIQQSTQDIMPEPADSYSQFNDYLGLSKLLQNVKINEENPLLYNSNQQQIQSFHNQQNLGHMNNNDRQFVNKHQKQRRLSWESDGSDPALVMSPSRNSDTFNPYADFQNHNLDFPGMRSSTAHDSHSDGFKQQLPPPPPSWRLPKAMRDHIISGAYQQQFGGRNSHHHDSQSKFQMPPPSMPPSQISPPGIKPPSMPDLPISSQQNLPGSMSHQMGMQSGMLPPTRSSSQQNGGQGGAPPMCCVFCRNNKESESVYTSHNLKDAEGRTVCPILRAYTCPICKANGDNSHTIKYCPENQNARYMQLPQHQQANPPPPPIFRPPPPPTQPSQRSGSRMSSTTSLPPHPMSFNLPQPQVPTKIR